MGKPKTFKEIGADVDRAMLELRAELIEPMHNDVRRVINRVLSYFKTGGR